MIEKLFCICALRNRQQCQPQLWWCNRGFADPDTRWRWHQAICSRQLPHISLAAQGVSDRSLERWRRVYVPAFCPRARWWSTRKSRRRVRPC